MKNFILIFNLLIIVNCGQNNTSKVNLEQTKSKSITILRGSDSQILHVQQHNQVGLSTPESVVIYKDGIYIANIGGSPLESPKKGFITEIKNNKITHLFNGLLDDPKGFAFLTDNIIIVSDHPTIKLLNITTEKVIATLEITNSGFLNDLILIDTKTALVSDTGKGLVYKISISPNQDSLKYTVVQGINKNGINGLAFDQATKILYFVTSTFGGDPKRGHIFEAILNQDYSAVTNLEQWHSTQLGAGGLDGIVLVNGQLIISDWGASATENASHIYIYNVADRSLHSTIKDNLTSAADITYSNGKIYVPEFLKQQLSIIHLK